MPTRLCCAPRPEAAHANKNPAVMGRASTISAAYTFVKFIIAESRLKTIFNFHIAMATAKQKCPHIEGHFWIAQL
jgi:hypothetical protein